MAEYVRVFCVALPTSESLWIPADRGTTYLSEIMKKWRSEHPEFNDTPCTAGVVEVIMPKENYHNILAHYGPGSFEFPMASQGVNTNENSSTANH